MSGASGAIAFTIQRTPAPVSRSATNGTNAPRSAFRSIEKVRSTVSGRTTNPLYHDRLVEPRRSSAGILPHQRVAGRQRVHAGPGEHHHGLDRGRHARIAVA